MGCSLPDSYCIRFFFLPRIKWGYKNAGLGPLEHFDKTNLVSLNSVDNLDTDTFTLLVGDVEVRQRLSLCNEHSQVVTSLVWIKIDSVEQINILKLVTKLH